MTLQPIPIDSEKLFTYNGYFNLKGLFDYLMNYLESEMFYDAAIKEFEETAKDGKKKIMAKVEADKFYTDYYKITLKFEINLSGKDAEVEINGKKLLLTDGCAKLKINSYLKPDWQAKRSQTAMMSFLTQIYNKYIGNDELKDGILECIKDRARLLNHFNKYLNTSI